MKELRTGLETIVPQTPPHILQDAHIPKDTRGASGGVVMQEDVGVWTEGPPGCTVRGVGLPHVHPAAV